MGETMDLTSLIVSALLSGLTTSLTDLTKSVMQGTFETFRKKLVEKTKNNRDVSDAMKKLEEDPDSNARRLLLLEELEKINIAQDKELVDLAKLVVEQLSNQERSSKFNLHIDNSQGIVVGDHNKLHQNFGARRKKKG
jgi:hypothetical protein